MFLAGSKDFATLLKNGGKSKNQGVKAREGQRERERQAAFFPNSGGRSFCSFWQLPSLSLPYLLPLLGNARTASISERVAKRGRRLSIWHLSVIERDFTAANMEFVIGEWGGSGCGVIGPLILFSPDQSPATPEPINTSFRSVSLCHSPLFISPYFARPQSCHEIPVNFEEACFKSCLRGVFKMSQDAVAICRQKLSVASNKFWV